MDHDSLIQLLPQLLNKGADKTVSGNVKSTQQQNNWYDEQACSDQSSNQTQSDSDRSSETAISEEEGTSEESDQNVEQQGRLSPKPVDLDEIEKFLDGISRSTTPRHAEGRPRGMANILREVDELGRRTLSSSSLPDREVAGRPPPSPRRPSEARSPVARPTGAASESALLKGDSSNRRVRFSRAQKTANRDEPTSASPHVGGAGRGKLSLSEPALGYTLQSLMSEEKKKYLDLTADMILLKQSSLESEIQMKSQWEEHVRDLMAENSSLKLEVEQLRSRPSPDLRGSLNDRSRLKNLEHRVEEQNRLLDGFNAENARLYRELKQLKTERSELETVVDDLQCEQRLLRARLEAAQRSPPAALAAGGQQQQQEQHLRRRELELERRWQEVQRAGNEVARLHELISQRRSGSCVRCRDGAAAADIAPGQIQRTRLPQVTSVSCQTVSPASPPRSPAASPVRVLARSPEHVAAAATAELRSLRAALVQAEQRLDQETQAAAVREADLRRACDAKVRAAEGRLRRLQSASPTRPDPELMAAVRRVKAQLADKERALTQSRRQLEKSQRTVTGLQREREKLLVTIAARSPDGRTLESRSCRVSPNRSFRVSPSRSQRASPSRRGSVTSAAATEGRCVDETLLSELQTAIAAVEEENVLLKDQLGQMKIHGDEEVSRRDSQIAKLRKENAELRAKLGALPSPSPSVGASEEDAVLSARKDSLMLEMGSHMEAQEHVIVHLRETIRRFQEQTRLIAGLEEENRALRNTIDTLRWTSDSAGGMQHSPDAVHEPNRSWAS